MPSEKLTNLNSYYQFFSNVKIQASIVWLSSYVDLYFELFDPQNIILHSQTEQISEIDPHNKELELQKSEQNNLIRGHELWKHTCFEAFLKIPNTTHYFEINQNSLFQWNVYEFDNYRNNMKESQNLILKTMTLDTSKKAVLGIHSRFQWSDTFRKYNNLKSLQVGLTSVLESVDHKTDYYAIAHTNIKPDFHHFDSFKLQLNLSENS